MIEKKKDKYKSNSESEDDRKKKKEIKKEITEINYEFLMEFYKLHKIKDDFKISIETVAKWLDCDKKRLVETLKRSYKINTDYKKILKSKKKNWGGSPRVDYLLSINRFKMLILKSHTKNSEKIRKYYIKLEKLLEMYKNEISLLYEIIQEQTT